MLTIRVFNLLPSKQNFILCKLLFLLLVGAHHLVNSNLCTVITSIIHLKKQIFFLIKTALLAPSESTPELFIKEDIVKFQYYLNIEAEQEMYLKEAFSFLAVMLSPQILHHPHLPFHLQDLLICPISSIELEEFLPLVALWRCPVIWMPSRLLSWATDVSIPADCARGALPISLGIKRAFN